MLEPEVSGGIGEGTIVDGSTHPPEVTNLNYTFDGWLGDALLETFPCFIVTTDLAKDLEAAVLTGFKCSKVQISQSEQFDEVCPGLQLPEFLRLELTGRPGIDDFGLSADFRLVASERALVILNSHGIEDCGIEPFDEKHIRPMQT